MSRRHIGSAIMPALGETAIHFEQEGCDALHRGLATEQQHVVFGMPQLAGGHGPEALRRPGRRCQRPAQGSGASPGGRWYRMIASAVSRWTGPDFQTEDVAGKVECADLAAAVVQQLVGTNCAEDHLIDVFGGLVLRRKSPLPCCTKIRWRSAPDMPGDDAELVGRAVGGAILRAV